MVYHEITILYNAIENTVANTINATYARRMMVRLRALPASVLRLSCILIGLFSIALCKVS